jgi:ribose/xylose/arabinose/galactoside ABC-type transport system permease subunit
MPVATRRRIVVLRPLYPHLAWEAVLLVALLVVALAARAAHPELFRANLVWLQWAIFGLVGTAIALSLRMGTPNLAVPAFAAAGSHWFVERVNGGESVAVAGIVAVLLCLLLGLVLGAFVGLTGAPAWAASLAAYGLVQALLLAGDESARPAVLRTGQLTSGDVAAWFLLFVLISVLGAIVLAVPSVAGRFVLPGTGFMSGRLTSALVGLGGSSAIAGLAGVLIARRASSSTPFVAFDLLLIALGVALLGGVSAYGLRGGVFGVVLASGLVAVIVMWSAVGGNPSVHTLVVSSLAIVVGLLVGWLMAPLSRRWVVVT